MMSTHQSPPDLIDMRSGDDTLGPILRVAARRLPEPPGMALAQGGAVTEAIDPVQHAA